MSELMDIKKKIWMVANKLPCQGLPAVHELVEACRSEGIALGEEGMDYIRSRLGGQGEIMVPKAVAQFVARILEPLSPASILDPWASLGRLSRVVHEALLPRRFDAYVPIGNHAMAWRHFDLASGFRVHEMEPLGVLASEEPYDAAIGFPPFGGGSHLESYQLPSQGTIVEIKDSYGHLLILDSCCQLNESGVGVFIVGGDFLSPASRKAGRARHALEQIGIHLTVAIELPPGTLSPDGAITAHIVVLSRCETGLLFAGRFSEDPVHQSRLLESLHQRIEGRTPEQGRIVPEESFQGFRGIELSEQLVQTAQRHGLVPFPFTEVVIELCSPRPSNTFEGFEEKSNAVYLPQMASTKATTTQLDLPEKLKSYYQLVVNPDLAHADFLAGLLNTSFGQLWRDSLRSGTTIPRISRMALERSVIYLPGNGGCSVQQRVVECQKNLTRLTTEVKELEARLWERPLSVSSIEKSVKRINREDRYEDWLETLPFPLASILWSCHTQTGSPKTKYVRKLQFFEAMAQFLGVVHLSAFFPIKTIWAVEQKPLFDALSKGKVSLEQTTFGTWSIILGFLSKRGRALLDKDEEMVFEMFKTRNRELLRCLLSPKVVSLVQEANKLRNDWVGHAGAVSDRQAADVNRVLDQNIHAVREVFGLIWEEYPLWIPGECRHAAGRFNHTAKKAMGTRTPFANDIIAVTEVMDDGELYLKSPDDIRALKLLPFVKILPSPQTEENACYFYNRRSGKESRFISYYFEGDPTIVKEFGDVALALGNIKAEIAKE